MDSQWVRTISIVIAIFSTSLILTACGNNGGGGGGAAGPAMAPVGGAGVLPTGPMQFIAVSNLNPILVNNIQGQQTPISQSRFQPGPGYQQIMRLAMGICDRNLVNGGYDIGYYSCATLSAAPQWITLEVVGPQATTANLSFYTDLDSFFRSNRVNGGFTSPSLTNILTGLFTGSIPTNFNNLVNPMVLSPQTVVSNSPPSVWPWNQNQGFEVRSFGPRTSAAYGRLIQLRVPVGKLENTSFDFELWFAGQSAGSGRMVRTR
ncbi:MAG: hypothetical protein WCH11_01350 [Bdellovibrio sp.]